MRTIVIIGNSAAGTSAAQALRERDKDARIVIVTDEPFLCYERPYALKVLDGSRKERDLVFRGKDFYANFRLELLTDKKVVEVSVHRRRLHFKDKESMDFDDLVVASGRRPAVPPLKGAQKEGVVAFNGLVEVRFIAEALPVAHTVLIVGETGVAQELARIMGRRGIDVKFFGALPEPVEGVEVIEDNPIIEVLGDSELRAVRLTNHKVIGASLLVFAGPREPHVDFLKGTDIEINRGILVDASFRTSIPYIFAVGDAAEPREGAALEGWEPALRQGQVLGGILCPT
jgi:NAD(P)H-nitrite reductase large subunit